MPATKTKARVDELQLLAAGILRGDYDAQLDALSHALRLRRQALTERALFEFRIGDRVRITTSRHGLTGREGVVEKVNRKTVSVRLDPLDEYDLRTRWRVTPTYLELA